MEEKENVYRARIKYSDEAIIKLCMAQRSAFASTRVLVINIICIGLMSGAVVAQVSTVLKLLMVAVGGITISFTNYGPKYKAKATISSMKGNYPETTYSFREEDILIESGGKDRQMEYSAVQRILHDDSYIYLFVSKVHAFMIDKNRMRPKDPDGLMKFVSGKSGAAIYRNRSKLSLRDMFRKR